MQEEVFGPVLTLQSFASDDEAVALANGTRFGLAGTLFSSVEAHAARITDALVAGTLWVNCFFVRDLAAPFGGAKESGRRPGGRHLELRLLLRRQERGRAPRLVRQLRQGRQDG